MARKTGSKSSGRFIGEKPLYEPLPEAACKVFDMMYDLCIAATMGKDHFIAACNKHGIKSRTGLYYNIEQLNTYVMYSRIYRNKKETAIAWEQWLKDDELKAKENTVEINGDLYYRHTDRNGKEWLHRIYLKEGDDEVTDEMIAAQHGRPKRHEEDFAMEIVTKEKRKRK